MTSEQVDIDLSLQDKTEVRNILQRYVPEFEVWAFGSRVNWTAKAHSDLDLALITKTPLSIERIAELEEAFDDSILPMRVDVVDWAATSETFQKIIKKQRVVIQEPGKALWKPYKISELGRVVTGKTPLSNRPSYRGNDVPFVTPPDFTGRKWINGTLRSISEEGAKSVKNSILPCSAVMVTCIGSDMGKAALSANRCVTNQQINSIIIDRTRFDPEFVYYNLSLRKDEITGLAGGSAQPILNKSAFSDMWIVCPTLEEQYGLVGVIRPIDDRIALLRETNATLEAIAQALFKSWFVDFDPVRAKMEGRAPEGIDEATAALFPDSFEESELGLVPSGWCVGTLGDIAQTARKQIQTNELRADSCYIGLEHIPRKSLCLASWGNAEGLVSTKSAFSEGDILFGKLRPYFHKVAIAPFAGVCSTDILVCQPQLPDFFGVVVMHLFSEALIEYADRLSNGAKMPRVSWKDLAAYQICIPPIEVAAKLNETIKLLIGRMIANVGQAKTLEVLRDTLLPRLISGQLRLSELTVY